MGVKLTTDSTGDLGKYAEERGIGIVPLSVVLGEKSYRDGVDITPQDIFSFVAETNILPKTAAPSIGDYEEYFAKIVDAGDEVVHFNISSKSSSSYTYALAAAKNFGGKVRVVDTRALSSGQGLLAMKASDMLLEGCGADEIVEETERLRPLVNTSFIPDRLDYLYKGGRCSRMQMYGANVLKIHPLIEMEDGQLVAEKKYRGSMEKCVGAYIDDLAAQYPQYDARRCFITHSSADESLVAFAKEKVAATFSFEEVLETVAGSVVTGHCGRNTLGVLFIAK